MQAQGCVQTRCDFGACKLPPSCSPLHAPPRPATNPVLGQSALCDNPTTVVSLACTVVGIVPYEPAEQHIEGRLQGLDCVSQGNGNSCETDVGSNVADGVHESRAKDGAKLLLGHGLHSSREAGGQRDQCVSSPGQRQAACQGGQCSM